MESSNSIPTKSISGTPYYYAPIVDSEIDQLTQKIAELRSEGKLSSSVLYTIQQQFRMKTIYHSNAIEGNQLTLKETEEVVSEGQTLSGKPLRDQREARNLSNALSLSEELVQTLDRPINETVIRQIHLLILNGIDNDAAGAYRMTAVKISGSTLTPTSPESIPAQMGDLNNWLAGSLPMQEEPTLHPIILASALHCWFVMIHPFVDGNGRTARILLNLVLMRCGYPSIVIPVEERMRFYDALAKSDEGDLTEFIQLVIEGIDESLEQWEFAQEEQIELESRMISLAVGAAEDYERQHREEEDAAYQVWRHAMELFKRYMVSAIQAFNDGTTAPGICFYFRDFGELDIDKYRLLKARTSAKRTWFFRIDYAKGSSRARYLFFFAYPISSLRDRGVEVVLVAAREWPSGSFDYQRISDMPTDHRISIYETGYDAQNEKMLAVGPGENRVFSGSMGGLAAEILESIVQCDV